MIHVTQNVIIFSNFLNTIYFLWNSEKTRFKNSFCANIPNFVEKINYFQNWGGDYL